MIRNPIDIASRVSPELSGFIENVIDELDSDEPVTLGAIRRLASRDVADAMDDSEETLQFDADESLVEELDELIDQFGESAAAEDFVSSFASEALSRAIDEVANDENRENPPTLGAVREALESGLMSRLIGDGVLEDDEADALIPELEGLIEIHGEDAPAEEFLRYE
jgi:hypothetical protein